MYPDAIKVCMGRIHLYFRGDGITTADCTESWSEHDWKWMAKTFPEEAVALGAKHSRVQRSWVETSKVVSQVSRSSYQEWCSGAMWHGWSCFRRFVCHCLLLSWAWGQRDPAVTCTCHLVFVWENHMALSAGTAPILSLSWWPGKAKSWWWTPVFLCKPFSFSILSLPTLLLLLCVSYYTPICFQ